MSNFKTSESRSWHYSGISAVCTYLSDNKVMLGIVHDDYWDAIHMKNVYRLLNGSIFDDEGMAAFVFTGTIDLLETIHLAKKVNPYNIKSSLRALGYEEVDDVYGKLIVGIEEEV